MAERQERLEQRRFEQAEALENVRFVRDRAADSGGLKPFTRLNLRNANLARLPLGCNPEQVPESCAYLDYADLAGADLSLADLRDASLDWANLAGAKLMGVKATSADFENVDLRDADLAVAELPDANLSGADLRGADLGGADVTRADLAVSNVSGADLRGADGLATADLGGICYDSSTQWPPSFEPPPPTCSYEAEDDDLPRWARPEAPASR